MALRKATDCKKKFLGILVGMSYHNIPTAMFYKGQHGIGEVAKTAGI